MHFLDIYAYQNCADIKNWKQFNDKLVVGYFISKVSLCENQQKQQKEHFPILTGNLKLIWIDDQKGKTLQWI